MKHQAVSESSRKYHFWRGFRSAAIVFVPIIAVFIVACLYAIDAMGY